MGAASTNPPKWSFVYVLIPRSPGYAQPKGSQSSRHSPEMERHQSMPEFKREFYEYHACLMEPWDGPASIAFSDGVQIGAVLDRNGLRPSRYYVTADDKVILASEVGVLSSIESKDVIKKGRLEPGRMFLIEMDAGRIVDVTEL